MNTETEPKADEVTGPSAPRPVVNGKDQGVKRRGRNATLGRPWSEKCIGELPDDDVSSESDADVEGGTHGKPQNSEGKSRSQSQVQVLLNLASDITLFHSADMRPYAKVFVPKQEEAAIAEHHQVLGVKSQAFKSWLLVAYLRDDRKRTAKRGVDVGHSDPGGQGLSSGPRRTSAPSCR